MEVAARVDNFYIVMIFDYADTEEPLIIGPEEDISIGELATMIGSVHWDTE